MIRSIARALAGLATLATLATGCIDEIDPQWQLAHDHVVAVRATPPAILPGESADLDALVAHADGPTTIEVPAEAAALQAPAALDGIVYTDRGRWFVYGPPEDTLAAARVELGLAADAPVPVDVYAAFPVAGSDPMYAKKRVWLGTSAANPPLPDANMDGAPMPAPQPGDPRGLPSLVVPRATDVYLSTPAGDGWRVNWLSSCGTLFQDDVATSFLRVQDGDRDAGELAVVVRAPDGGVAWRVWPIRAE